MVERKLETAEIARLVGAAIFVILFIAFILGNSQSVKVSFVFFDTEVPLIWVLVVTALLGAAVDRLVSISRRSAKKRAPGP